MHIIPVLDLKAGRVVRAHRGERDRYLPLQCELCNDSAPGTVLDALLALHPFPIVYLADIDAITAAGDNLPAVTQLCAARPAIRFWLDAGWRAPPAPGTAGHCANLTAVIGSETHVDAAALRRLAAGGGTNFVLSLDHDAGGFRGRPDLADDASAWPRQIIVMELDRVGAGGGPGLERLRGFRNRHPGRQWYAAGGVRDKEDLRALAAAGAAGALIASALYDGRLQSADITAFEVSADPA